MNTTRTLSPSAGAGLPTVAALLVGASLPLLLLPAGLQGQGWDDVEVSSQDLGAGIHMLTGRGGNLGVSAGPDGVFLVDDQYAPLTEKILAAIARITDEPVRFVVNTHWHGDHTGGNENLGEAGSLLVAHENVRRRLNVEQVLERYGRAPDTVPASPEAALPVVTFTDEVSFHMNGEEIRVLHVPHAHTDGDAIIRFVGADVVHMGDTFFHGMYPFIDVSSGGTIDGVLESQERALALMGPDTKVIPGHGPLTDREGLQATRDMLRTIRDRVATAKREGRSLESVQAMGVTAEWDDEFGGGFITPDALVYAIYQSLPRGR